MSNNFFNQGNNNNLNTGLNMNNSINNLQSSSNNNLSQLDVEETRETVESNYNL